MVYNIGDIVTMLPLEDILSKEGVTNNNRSYINSVVYKGKSYPFYVINPAQELIIISGERGGFITCKRNDNIYSSDVEIPIIFVDKKVGEKKYHSVRIMSDRGIMYNILYMEGYNWICSALRRGGGKFPLSVYERSKFTLINIDGLSKKDFYKITSKDKTYLGFKRMLSKFKTLNV